MSATTTTATSVHIGFYPALPPTNNDLDPEQRSRLLRSTRKLEALLGTTPFLLEPEVEAPPPTPRRARATRREGRIFHSPSSSVSSLDSTEPEYVLINSNIRSAPYQVQAIPSFYPSPSSSRSASPMSVDRDVKKVKGDLSTAPIATALDIPGSQARSGATTTGAKKGKGPQALAQPLLLRLRSVPPTDVRIKAATKSARQATAAKQQVSNSKPLPLSPVASSFNISMDIAQSPITPTFSPATGLTDREKRRKIAKLTRTLGENVPPELIFGQTAQVSNNRRTSLSIGRPRATDIFSHKSSKSVAHGALPALAVAEAPMPPAKSAFEQKTSVPLTQMKRKHRPRSLTLGSSSAIAAADAAVAARGTTSLDVRPTAAKAYRERVQQPQQPFVSSEQQHKKNQSQATVEEWGRRKEKEWSGEWNMEMEQVTKALRCLKGR